MVGRNPFKQGWKTLLECSRRKRASQLPQKEADLELRGTSADFEEMKESERNANASAK